MSIETIKRLPGNFDGDSKQANHYIAGMMLIVEKGKRSQKPVRLNQNKNTKEYIKIRSGYVESDVYTGTVLQ